MTIESLPTFTKPARQRWESIPVDIRQRLLSNVWCGHCRHETTITNFSGTIKGGDLLLVGRDQGRTLPRSCAAWGTGGGVASRGHPRADRGREVVISLAAVADRGHYWGHPVQQHGGVCSSSKALRAMFDSRRPN